MSYVVVLEPAALDDLAALPPGLATAIRAKLEVLAISPYEAKTRPARPPYAVGQLYRTQFRFADVTCLLDVVYLYGQDEQHLYVIRVYVEYS